MYVHIGDEKLYLTNVEEVMGLYVGYTLVTDTICHENEKALLYTFSNEDYDVQIMEKSDGESFARVNYREQDETCVYKCMTEEIYRVYADFLNGSLSAYTNKNKTATTSIWDIMIPKGEPGNCYRTEYAFFDMNNDGIQECHIRSDRYYEIYKIYEGELYLWGTQYPQTELFSNGDLLYTHIGGANRHEDYTYIVLDDDGETMKEVSFGWGDNNPNSVMDADGIPWILLQEEYQYKQDMLTYQSVHDLSYDELVFVNDDTYEVIKEEYNELDFYSKFVVGDSEKDKKCKDKYFQLLKGELSFWNETEQRDYFIDEINELPNVLFLTEEPKEFVYYYFDIDGDNVSELGISDGVRGQVLLDYDEEQEKIVVCKVLGSTWYGLCGTNMVYWDREGTWKAFYTLDLQGNEKVCVSYLSEQHYNDFLQQDEALTFTYEQAESESRENIDTVTFTYEEILEKMQSDDIYGIRCI